MQASSLTTAFRRGVVFSDWAWWRLPALLRCYVAVVPTAALVGIAVAAARTEWHVHDVSEFVLLACCGAISAACTPRMMYSSGGVTRDLTTIWVLPAAILLPPVYAALAPFPIFVALYLSVHRGVIHRTVFTATSNSLGFLAVSLAFRSFPRSVAGPAVGSGVHALTWALAVTACYLVAGKAQHFLIVAAVKLSDPNVRIRDLEGNREGLQALFVEIDLGVLITLALALTPALVLIALPTVLLVRRFLVHPLLVAQSRVDSKTGLLNVSTWEREAEAEISRCVRTQSPLSLLLVDIDHFKSVNDTYGHLVGDRVLRAVAEGLTSQLRDYDKAGRFGGEEFVLLLAQTTEKDACRIAERLRAHIDHLAVPVDDSTNARCVRLTISVGVTAIEAGHSRELTDLLAAADSALYYAKQAGRNKVAVARLSRGMELEVVRDGHPAGVVERDPAGASLCPEMSLSVPVRAHHESS